VPRACGALNTALFIYVTKSGMPVLSLTSRSAADVTTAQCVICCDLKQVHKIRILSAGHKAHHNAAHADKSLLRCA
jgi:hypothetical protein